MDCSPPDSSVHGIFQAGILEWVAIPFSRGSFWPRDESVSFMSPALAGGFFTTSSIREATLPCMGIWKWVNKWSPWPRTHSQSRIRRLHTKNSKTWFKKPTVLQKRCRQNIVGVQKKERWVQFSRIGRWKDRIRKILLNGALKDKSGFVLAKIGWKRKWASRWRNSQSSKVWAQEACSGTRDIALPFNFQTWMNSERKGLPSCLEPPPALSLCPKCSPLSKVHRVPPGVLRSYTSIRPSLCPPRAHSPVSSSFSLSIHSVNIPFTILKQSIGIIIYLPGLPWLTGKESACQCKRHGFNPWVRKIPWSWKWQTTPVFLPGKNLSWEIPWTEETGGLQSTGLQRVGHDWVTEHTHTLSYMI